MHRWHSFNDAIVLESIGIHDHPRPVKEYTEPQHIITASTWSNKPLNRLPDSSKQRILASGVEDDTSTASVVAQAEKVHKTVKSCISIILFCRAQRVKR